MATYSVSVATDHLGRLMARKPIRGLSELVWNAFDADADKVQIDVERSVAGGVDAIVVTDDGHGMSPEEAKLDFSRLGGSWKHSTQTTRGKGRSLHGSNGEGRWTAFALGGSSVRWETVAEVDGKRFLTIIQILREASAKVEISDPVPTTRDIGTIARVEGITTDPHGALGDPGLNALTVHFALHLKKYPDTSLVMEGRTIDVADLVERHDVIPLDVPNTRGPAELDIVEWSKPIDRALYYCDERGLALGEGKVGIHAPNYVFTAFIRWRGFAELQDQLLLEDLGHAEFAPIIEAAREAMRAHFKSRDAEWAVAVVQVWKDEDSYPYDKPVQTEPERIERELFDLVAATAAPAISLGKTNKETRKLTLGLIRAALETGPSALRRVFAEVLKLSQGQLDELDRLLGRTTLANIVKTSAMICDRLDFLADLEDLVCSPDSQKRVTERSQLHRIVEQETWIFGEQYAVASSDRSLTQCLEQHRKLLGRDELADESPVLLDGKRQIVDLMLWRGIPQGGENSRQFLIVELKRPSVVVSRDELGQIEDYARAVVKDSRFTDTATKWDFIVVSTEVHLNIEDRRHQLHEVGLVTDLPTHRISVLTWAQVIKNAQYRLAYVQKALSVDAADQSAASYMQREYGALLPEEMRGTTPVSAPPPRPDPRPEKKPAAASAPTPAAAAPTATAAARESAPKVH